MPIVVELPAPFLTLELLVAAMTQAVVSVKRAGVSDDSGITYEVAAGFECECSIRDLAQRRELKGYAHDTLAESDWFLLDLEGDLFHVDNLNSCPALTARGFQFTVAPSPEEERSFVAAFEESVHNGAPIRWSYWVGKMPTLSTVEASRLMSGLDPDQYSDLHARPNSNDVSRPCRRARDIERLAAAEGLTRKPPREWLIWAEAHGLGVHLGFVDAVNAETSASSDSCAESDQAMPSQDARVRVKVHRTTDARSNILTPIVEEAVRRAGTDDPPARAWAELEGMARGADRPNPLAGVNAGGVQYFDGKAVRTLTSAAFRDRLRRRRNAR